MKIIKRLFGAALVAIFFFIVMYLTDFDWVGLIFSVAVTAILVLGVYLLVTSYKQEKE